MDTGMTAARQAMSKTALDEVCEDARHYRDMWKAAERREGRLREGLAFYADPATYEERPVGAPWDGGGTEYAIWEDQGLTARDALGDAPGLMGELAELRRHAAAWKRLCAIDKARQATHRKPMLPKGVMDEVNAVALGACGRGER